MKNFIFSLFSLIFILLGLISCSEDLPLSANFKETAVIYSLLDKSEDIHFVKINRAFIGPGSSLDIAQIPDSSYFKNVEAVITENGGSNRTWNLKDTLIENKETNGVFYAPEQKLYYFQTNSNAPLNDNATYYLKVTIDKGLSTEFVVTANTKLVSGVSVSGLSSLYLNVANSNHGYSSPPFSVNTGNSALINSSIEINVNEFIGSNSDSITIPMKLDEIVTNNKASLTFTINGENFYKNLADGLTNNTNITKRNILGVNIVLTAGSSELNNYILANKPSSSLSQNKPSYTNLSVNTTNNKVIGLFSSRVTAKYYLPFCKSTSSYYYLMNSYSLIELCTGKYTGTSHFCSQSSHDISESYHCN